MTCAACNGPCRLAESRRRAHDALAFGTPRTANRECGVHLRLEAAHKGMAAPPPIEEREVDERSITTDDPLGNWSWGVPLVMVVAIAIALAIYYLVT